MDLWWNALSRIENLRDIPCVNSLLHVHTVYTATIFEIITPENGAAEDGWSTETWGNFSVKCFFKTFLWCYYTEIGVFTHSLQAVLVCLLGNSCIKYSLSIFHASKAEALSALMCHISDECRWGVICTSMNRQLLVTVLLRKYGRKIKVMGCVPHKDQSFIYKYLYIYIHI